VIAEVTETKVCSRCGERLPIESYYFVSKKLGTRRGQCKACMKDLKAMQKDPDWKPACSRCGVEMERFGPGRRLCAECFDQDYDLENARAGGSHRLKLKPCSACGAKRLREDHTKGGSLCPICRAIPQSRRKRLRGFNLTPREFVEMLEAQRHRCPCCLRPIKGAKVNVDHQHSEPMIVRGLVCGRCNTLLGMARDNAGVLAGCASYLLHPPAQAMFPGRCATLEANRSPGEWRALRRGPAALAYDAEDAA
jgi:hypothetical protein